MIGKKQRLIRAGRLVLHLLRLSGFALGVALLLALFHLLVIGLPQSMTRQILSRLQESEIPLRFESIRLSIHRGWVLNNVRLYSASPDDLQPLFSAQKVYVWLWPASREVLTQNRWMVSLSGKNIAVSFGPPWEKALSKGHPFRTIEKLKASLIPGPGQVTIEAADLRWGGAGIHTRGRIRTQAGPGGEGSAAAPQPVDFRRQAADAAEAMGKLKFDKPPQLYFDFDLNKARPEENVITANLSAEGLNWRNRIYGRLNGSLGYRDRTLTLTSLALTQPNGEKLALHGVVHGDEVQFSIENTLPAADLLNLLPSRIRAAIAEADIKPLGQLNFTAAFGPAPRETLLDKFQIEVQQAPFRRADLTLDPLSFSFARTGDRLEFNNLRAQANGGAVTGSGEFNLVSQAWTAHAETRCDPAPVGTFIGGGLQEFIGRFRFTGQPLHADLTLSQAYAKAPLSMTGTMAADQFTCAGIQIGHFETSLVYSNEVLDLTPLHIVRDREQFDGSVQVDFIRDLGFFNVTNSFPPPDIARILAPGEHTALELFRFAGPVLLSGSGRMDFGSWTNHAFRGTFRGENIGAGKVQTGLLTTSVEGRGAQLFFTNSTIQLYGGLAEGSADFDLLLRDGSAPYRFDARITGIDLAKMLQQTTTGDHSRTRGQLSAALNFTANASTGFWQSVQGGGRVEIENGRLADVPLLGGFSRLIRNSFPAFNLFSLTTLSADYALHDGAVWSDNVQLGGTILSARGRGSYSPESGLNFVVQTEPLRQTRENKEWYQAQLWAADALRLGISPLFRLLEVELTGRLDNPDWRFANLPK